MLRFGMWIYWWVLIGYIVQFIAARVDDWNPCDVKDARLSAERPVALSGRWVSHRCEIRAGPKYLLRSYEFGYNTSFMLQQYYYSDDCTTPLYSLTIRGILNEMKKSWMLPGAIDVDYTLTKITVMPYSQDQADILQAAVLKVCPLARFSVQPWLPYEYQEILNFELHPTTPTSPESGVSRIDLEFDCLDALNFTFDELHLIRLQRRRWSVKPGVTVSRKELFTGETPKGLLPDQQDAQRPVSYLSDFLVKIENEGLDCRVCDLLAKVQDPTSPPLLNGTAASPPLSLLDLEGRWQSLAECESRPSGSFIRRILTLDTTSFTWTGEYQHFTEPDCQQRSFTILGSGTFVLEEPYSRISSAQKIDFMVVNATVTPHLDFVLQQLATSNATECGVGPWILNRPKDITPTNGCKLLGLTIPNADYNIVRLERDVFNNTHLHLGQDYQEVNSAVEPLEISATRPTSFQPALLQCSQKPSTTATFSTTTMLRPTGTHQDGGGNSSPQTANITSNATTTTTHCPVKTTVRIIPKRNCANNFPSGGHYFHWVLLYLCSTFLVKLNV